MKRLTTIVLAVAGVAASAVGCASRPPEIELTSSDFDLNPLVGEWRGDYSNPETGRSGTIAFTLRAGESSASGKVVMIPGKADSLASAAAVRTIEGTFTTVPSQTGHNVTGGRWKVTRVKRL